MKRYLLISLSFLVFAFAQAAPKENVAYVDVNTREAVFHLPENPTTGFRWFVTSPPNAWIEQTTYRYEAPAAGMPGQGGTAVFRFVLTPEAMAVPRLISVSITSARAWEPEVGQEKRLWLVVAST